MQGILEIVDLVLPLAYASLVAVYLKTFLNEEAEPRFARALLWGVLLVHGIYFVARGAHFSYFPLGSKAEFFSWLTYSISAVYAALERQLKQVRTGVFFVSIALAFQTAASVFMEYDPKHPLLLENPMYGVHVIFVIFGVTALAVGTLYATMYLLLNRQLKARELGLFFKRLPPLNTLDRLSRVGSLAGTVVLGFGLVVGYLVALSLPEDFNFWDPKLLITDAVWLGYVVGVLLVRYRGLPSIRVAQLTIAWFAVFLVSVGIGHSFLA